MKHTAIHTQAAETSARLLFIAALLVAAPAFGQDDATASEPISHFGLRIGPTAAFLSGSYISDGGIGEWGIELKLTADRRVFANVEFVTGFGMIQKGGREIVLVDTDSLLGYRFSYLQVPMMLRPVFRIGDGRWRLAPFSGVYVAFNPGCKLKDARFFGFEDDCTADSPGGLINGTELGVPLGLDAISEFPGGLRIEFEVRYDFGLTNVFSNATDVNQIGANRVVVLEFGFSYPL